MTPLNAADGQIYAVAQGTILAGGTVAEGEAATCYSGGADGRCYSVWRPCRAGDRFRPGLAEFHAAGAAGAGFHHRWPDRTCDQCNEFGGNVALMRDSGTVEVDIRRTNTRSTAHAVGRIENILVEPQRKARVVVDQRSGTIVMGSDVRISRVAVAQGNLTLRIEETPLVVQPNPFCGWRNGCRAAYRCCH